MSVLTWLNRPWLHFVALGLVLFLLQRWAFPPPVPVIGPLSEARKEALDQQWLATTRQPPTEEQRLRMQEAELERDVLFQRAMELELYRHDSVIYQRLLRNMRFLGLDQGQDDEALYREALDMGLHLGDEVIKRRMIQVMEQLLLLAHPPAAVDDAALATAYEERREALRQPTRYTLQHLYYPREKVAEIAPTLERLRNEGIAPSQALSFSAPFLPGYRFAGQSPDQLARQFGAAFVMNLERLQPQPGQWVGPVQSSFGQHLVWVEAIEPARDAELAEVRQRLQRDLESEARNAALASAVAQLRSEYEVRL